MFTEKKRTEFVLELEIFRRFADKSTPTTWWTQRNKCDVTE